MMLILMPPPSLLAFLLNLQVVPQDAAGWAEWRGAVHSGPMHDVGNFIVLYDEAEADHLRAERGDEDGARGGARDARPGAVATEEDDLDLPKSLLGR